MELVFPLSAVCPRTRSPPPPACHTPPLASLSTGECTSLFLFKSPWRRRGMHCNPPPPPHPYNWTDLCLTGQKITLRSGLCTETPNFDGFLKRDAFRNVIPRFLSDLNPCASPARSLWRPGPVHGGRLAGHPEGRDRAVPHQHQRHLVQGDPVGGQVSRASGTDGTGGTGGAGSAARGCQLTAGSLSLTCASLLQVKGVLYCL